MLSILCEEGEIFDKLSVINVKLNLSNDLLKQKNIENFEFLANQIKKQIGELKYSQIIGSDYYKDLYEVNLKLFKLVDLAQKDDGLAGQVDKVNYDRFKKKSQLQKFFFTNEVKEIKIGYNGK